MPQATIHRLEAGIEPFRDAEVTRNREAVLDRFYAEAKKSNVVGMETMCKSNKGWMFFCF